MAMRHAHGGLRRLVAISSGHLLFVETPLARSSSSIFRGLAEPKTQAGGAAKTAGVCLTLPMRQAGRGNHRENREAAAAAAAAPSAAPSHSRSAYYGPLTTDPASGAPVLSQDSQSAGSFPAVKQHWNARYPITYFTGIHPGEDISLSSDPALLAAARATVDAVNAVN
jgi:hypothetical protein